MQLDQLAALLSQIARAHGWDVCLVTDNGDDVVGVVLADPDHVDRLMAPGYDYSHLTTTPQQ